MWCLWFDSNEPDCTALDKVIEQTTIDNEPAKLTEWQWLSILEYTWYRH